MLVTVRETADTPATPVEATLGGPGMSVLSTTC
jgi:hypothetical protein